MSELFFKGSRNDTLLPLKAECLGPNGAVHVVNFKGRFRLVPADEQKELRQALADKTMTGEEIIRRILIGWQDVFDTENEPVEFTSENLDAALQNPFYLDAFGEGALLIIYGKKTMAEVKRKNS